MYTCVVSVPIVGWLPNTQCLCVCVHSYACHTHAVLVGMLLLWHMIRYEYDWYRSKILAKKIVADTFSALLLPNLSGEISSPLQAQPSLTKMRFRSTAERCMKMCEDVEASRSIDTDLLSIYVWLYVRFLKYVSIFHNCFILWIPLVKPQSGVKATLKNIWSQNAKEPGDACRIPRGAWKLHRCIEHATRWILYRMIWKMPFWPGQFDPIL